MSQICPNCGKEHNYRYRNGQCGICYQRAAYRADSRYRANKKANVNKNRALNPRGEARTQRKQRLKRLGLSLEEYDSLLAKQGGVCAICKRPPGKKRLAVDHNHKTGAIRGLLCFRCNYGLSWFNDNPEWLRRAATHCEGGEPAMSAEPQCITVVAS